MSENENTPRSNDYFLASGPIDHLYNKQTGELTKGGEQLIVSALDLIQAACWTVAEDHGFHDDATGARGIGLITALLHSEISEAFESWRAGEPMLWFDDKYTDAHHPDPFNPNGTIRKGQGVFAELADVLIRIGDNTHELQLDGANASLAEAFIYKFRYNLTRPYKHGKIA